MSAPAATQVTVPNIGDFSDVPIIEVHVSPGDTIAVDDPLLTLESDKATMDVPSSQAGTVVEVLVSVGDAVSEGTPVVMLDAGEGEPTDDGDAAPEPSGAAQQADTEAAAQEPDTERPSSNGSSRPPSSNPSTATPAASELPAHAGPSVRKLAREFGVDLAQITASGPKGRITKEDLLSFVRGGDGASAPAAAAPAPAAQGSGIPEIPAQDFSVFGEVETQPLSRITRISGPFLHRSWLNVPHVTHNDDADITDTDRYRKELDTAAKAEGYRVTLLAFLMKASVSALKAFPTVNASLTPEKDALILKRYYHIGVAVDTPGGLVVPVIRDVDRKGIVEISKELGEVSARAREGKLTGDDMKGGTFTISSLGGIGGTAFTPIVNAPEVAILGVVRSRVAPVWNGTEFEPRTLLPLCFSYDHRVIDGALAARFTRHVAHTMGDERRLLL
ncbi:dihydrolipoyllysine-residue acetyltransferase [Actinomycetospora corticicola]|uniref:Dihydrolipoamide acetyltransferase component of pyruvate dehydrogenase complex n=1 Tax=Actinomycetospora corticicola TaxID=663602 RepID=A0A7Y9J4C0_9PSEU|nr:2-oxo acid dehydrogenase subunit E2 [Actinomycetospora corticicola]NYD34912.1 pyruvate dehydrogenase E2 component (dihydrolipoamide acetyltransferase) [Actinomycetospora corticicola]